MDGKQFSIVTVKGKRCKPFEYLCLDCGQLRLAYVKTNKCRNCNSKDIVKGKIGTFERK